MKWSTRIPVAVAATTVAALLTIAPAQHASAATAVISSADCLQHEVPANDDSSSAQVALPFGINFYGETFQSLWVNNNGNVTFDQPLATYTPFGLSGTGAQIIAPFFADVDTRASNTVAYGWGNTTYKGHRAFCVNWIDVGYFANRNDKLNSFQLLLVQREETGHPGDFDIVFNYDKIEWETGDASGGVNGLGGSSARAGFSNGSGNVNTSYEMPGSGVNGGLLDSNQTTGLTNYSTLSTLINSPEIVPGRHTFAVRSGGAPLTNYVALGDSYQSGEGAGDYTGGTDSDDNKCHRSAHAYPERLVADGIVNLDLDFGACSGAKTTDLDKSSSQDGPPWDDGVSQYGRLNSATKLVTIGIGGNDVGFSSILKDCIKSIFSFSDATCQQKYVQQLEDNWDELVDGDVLAEVYRTIRERAPYARIAVLGYPRFYPEGGAENRYEDGYCAGVRITDQIWINAGIRRLDEHIRDQARSYGMQYIDVYNTSDGHELCGDSDEHFMNGIKLTNQVESYHPRAYGHQLLAYDVGRALVALPPGDLFNVRPGETIYQTFPVSGESFDISTQWPGSDVVLTLTSPSGRLIDRQTVATDVAHEVGPTFESYHIDSPEQGTWTASLYGAQVAPGGEETRLDIYQGQGPAPEPVATIEQTMAGRTVTVDGSGSTPGTGSIVRYLWEFGDGTTGAGPTASHTYTSPGTYLVTLAVLDSEGNWAVASAPQTVTVTRYNFSGFKAPVDNEPTVNTTKAGSSVPVKFSLTGDQGLDILATGSPTSSVVDCTTGAPSDEIESTATAGQSTLTYDHLTDTYTYVWKTKATWSGTCRELRVTLTDGTTKTALFNFR